jgi:hypothetical protein
MINGKFTAFVYYYGKKKKKYINILLIDKILKKKLENDIDTIYSINFSINLFNILNFLPTKVHKLNKKLQKTIRKSKKFL